MGNQSIFSKQCRINIIACLVILILVPATSWGQTRYNEVRQKGSHNSYERTEGYVDQALFWRIRSLEIDIHTSNHLQNWPDINGDWYVYHTAAAPGSSVNKLSDVLDLLWSFHLAVPDHEVITLWLDLKDDFSQKNNHTPAQLDRLLKNKLKDSLWGPPNLIGSHANLQQAVRQQGWPSLESLKGKFIVACTTGDLSAPDSHLNQYVSQGETANRRMAFVAPQIKSSKQINSHNYAVFFNLNSSHVGLGKEIHEKGFISRAYGLGRKAEWCKAWSNQVNHLTTDNVNALKAQWARTDNPRTGYPFSGIDRVLPDDLAERVVLDAIKVNSGDIWNKKDSFYFQYDDLTTGPDRQIVTFVSDPVSHVNGWIKGGIMARESTEADAAYIAVLRTGTKGIRMQFRNAKGASSNHIDAAIPKGANGKPLVGENSPIWLSLSITDNGNTGVGSYSIDGIRWQPIGRVTVEPGKTLTLQGWAASSHGAGDVKWLFGGDFQPGQGIPIGAKAQGQFIQSNGSAASLGPEPAQDHCR